MAVLKLFADLVERKHTIGVVEENGPLTVFLFPGASVSVNDAFAKIGAEDLNKHCCSRRIDVFCASPSFNESVNPLHRIVVVPETRV